jgi:predicted Zn-dependent protease with MMP-like domain
VSNDPRPRIRRRDRHGRGLRGRLVPPAVPLYRSRAEQFDDLVLDAVGRLEPRWEAELSGVEFAVQEVPDDEELSEDAIAVPLARTAPGSLGTPTRIVLYRRPLMARAEDDEELAELIFGVVVEEIADLLGIDPEEIDPGYGLP